MRLRPFLGLLTAGAIIPVAFFGVLVGVVLVDQSRESFRRGVQEGTQATNHAIDATIQGSIATLEALGAALEVDAKDFRPFRTVATRVLATQPDWSNINLALPSGQQVVNLARPQGARLHSIAGIDDSLEIIHRTGGPVVNDIAFGTATQAWDIAVRVPIVRDGDIRYILTGVVKPEAIADVIKELNLSPGWMAYVIDRKGRLIAGMQDSELRQVAGEPAPAAMWQAVVDGSKGWASHRGGDTGSRYVSYQRSNLTGWTLAIDMPASAADAVVWRAAWMLAAGLVAAIAMALVLSYVVGRRRLLQPIEALAAATVAVGRGEERHIPNVRSVDEIRALSGVLRAAVEAMHERQQLAHREKEALQSADRAKDEFIAMLSHELRNPLAALTAAAHLMKVGGASGETRAQVQRVVERQTEQMTRLVEDLLDISRVTMGKANLQLETFDLGRAVHNLVAVWRSAGRLDQHAVSADTSEVWVRADRARMEQVVSNLLDNALKYTPPGKSIRLAVRAERDEAVLEVRDEGEGLSDAMVHRVFDLFVQGERSLDRGKGGLGIGLALVKRMAELHGGSVAVASPGLGKGATFTVRLPLAALPSGLGKGSRREWTHPAKPLRVLLVEDNDDTRRMLSAALAHDGHHVREARDGASAVSMASELKPDAVLLDIGLPDVDGYEVARRIRAGSDGPHPLIIAVTGYGQKEDQERAAAAGFDIHLTKPVSPEVLSRALGAQRT